ncbi:RFX DNA-binding domain-containing protein [Lophiotrema nucula]|uniref:RFX DNA-binding domain-containing protein n=1 Tax=Lophiotrema nucula TaxID=690887 RepID=A0A6A5Z8Q6_9PLEO|nr:RFX DNA-binding domain-containing protein [Lophiotrema nucula]
MANDPPHPQSHRSRSNTSISTSTRPVSRASTTSVNSFAPHDPSSLQAQYQQQQQHPHAQQQNAYAYGLNTVNGVYQPLDTSLLQAAQQASQQEGMPVDHVTQLVDYNGSLQHGAVPNGLPYSQDANSQALATMSQQQYLPVQMEVEEKKKKGSASGSLTNDRELREMLNKNSGRDLKDVAAEVIATDRTSKAEKSKQLFAMLWLRVGCAKAKTSVPRNRVYSRYAERCATERVIPLNPASFGKLVRVIFPNIQTRRLGVRGESKYHYVDLALVNDSEDGDEGRRSVAPTVPHVSRRQASLGPRVDFNSVPRVPADTAAFPAPDPPYDNHHGYTASQLSSSGLVFTNIFSSEFHPTAHHATAQSYQNELKFPSPDLLAAPDDFDIILPDIAPYLPARTDPDSAGALVNIYRTHCTSLVDAVRYCKEKQFFRLFTSFHGTMTVPVQKLFAQPELAAWIKECDYIMYQKMIRNLSQIALQVAPAPVLKFLHTVSNELHRHISRFSQNLPLHVLEARLESATLFSHLLRDMVQVNSTAHAAAVMLMNDQMRDLMWYDWSSHVNYKRIMENELPASCAHEEIYRILATEIRGLLLPLSSNAPPNGNFSPQTSTTSDDPSNETVIDRIATFLINLPARFPNASARTIIHCIDALGSSALRLITIEGGGSFQSWWLTKVFIDGMIRWLASLGGFLSHRAPTHSNWNNMSYSLDAINATLAAGGSGSNDDSRYSSIDADFAPEQSFISNNGSVQDTGSANTENTGRRLSGRNGDMSFNWDLDLATSQQDPSNDDSGIGLIAEETVDAKLNMTLHQSLAQLPAGAS